MAIKTLDQLVNTLKPVFTRLGLPAPTTQDVLRELANQERAELHATAARLHGMAGNPFQDQKPLRDDRGRTYGHSKAEIPDNLMMFYTRPRRLGGLGLTPKEAEKVILAEFPQLKVNCRMTPRFNGVKFRRPGRPARARFDPAMERRFAS